MDHSIALLYYLASGSLIPPFKAACDYTSDLLAFFLLGHWHLSSMTHVILLESAIYMQSLPITHTTDDFQWYSWVGQQCVVPLPWHRIQADLASQLVGQTMISYDCTITINVQVHWKWTQKICSCLTRQRFCYRLPRSCSLHRRLTFPPCVYYPITTSWYWSPFRSGLCSSRALGSVSSSQ